MVRDIGAVQEIDICSNLLLRPCARCSAVDDALGFQKLEYPDGQQATGRWHIQVQVISKRCIEHLNNAFVSTVSSILSQSSMKETSLSGVSFTLVKIRFRNSL